MSDKMEPAFNHASCVRYLKSMREVARDEMNDLLEDGEFVAASDPADTFEALEFAIAAMEQKAAGTSTNETVSLVQVIAAAIPCGEPGDMIDTNRALIAEHAAKAVYAYFAASDAAWAEAERIYSTIAAAAP